MREIARVRQVLLQNNPSHKIINPNNYGNIKGLVSNENTGPTYTGLLGNLEDHYVP